MKKAKIKTIMFAGVMTIMSATIPYDTVVTDTYAVGNNDTVSIADKHTVIHNDMSYLVETYNNNSIVIKAQYTGESSSSLKNFSVIEISVPVGMFTVDSTFSQTPTFTQTGKIEETFDIYDTYTFTISSTAGSFTVSQGLVATFTLTPAVSDPDITAVKIYDDRNSRQTVEDLKVSIAEYENSISRLDTNGDGIIDAVDASVLLQIYAYNSTNGTPVTKLSDFWNIAENTEETTQPTTSDSEHEPMEIGGSTSNYKEWNKLDNKITSGFDNTSM